MRYSDYQKRQRYLLLMIVCSAEVLILTPMPTSQLKTNIINNKNNTANVNSFSVHLSSWWNMQIWHGYGMPCLLNQLQKVWQLQTKFRVDATIYSENLASESWFEQISKTNGSSKPSIKFIAARCLGTHPKLQFHEIKTSNPNAEQTAYQWLAFQL